MTTDLKLLPNDISVSTGIFQKEKERLIKLLPDYSVEVEHVGSTSIPNTIGKGIIDILLICEDESAQAKIREILARNGYRQGELNKIPDGRLFFSNTPSQTQAGDVHLHLVIKGSNNLESLSFRDHLLTHPEIVDQYNQLKLGLENSSGGERAKYTAQKAPFIQDVMRKIGSK